MHKVLLLVVFLLAIFLCLHSLGNWAFQDYDEAIYARVFHESLLRSDFINFTFLGQPWIDKPPLYFWLAKISSSLFGESEFSLRLPSALLTILSIFLVFKISLTITKSKTTALISALILLTTSLFIFTGRQLRLDVPVTTAILLSYYAFLKTKRGDDPIFTPAGRARLRQGIEDVKNSGRADFLWFLVFCLGLTSVILFKSVIGLLIFPIIFIHSFVYRDWKWIRSPLFWTGILLALLLIIPWHLQQYVEYGNMFWSRYFFNVSNRLGGQILLGQNLSIQNQLWQLSLAIQPWFWVFIVTTIGMIILKPRSKFALSNALIAGFLILIFLIPKNRLLYYFVPSLPFIAISIAAVFGPWLKKNPRLFTCIFIASFIIGITNTTLRIFSQIDRDFFLRETSTPNRYQIAEDEKKVGLLARARRTDELYLYRWQFYPTLLYYSGKDDLYRIPNLQDLPKTGLLLIPRPLGNPLSKPILYQGKAAILLKMN